MYGMPRQANSYRTRLLNSIDDGMTEFYVDTGMDWQAGEEFAVLTNTLSNTHTEYFTIQDYNSLTGMVTVTQAAQHYHFGALSVSTRYNGLDIRAEVVLLTRNVKITGYDEDGWGGQIVTGDLYDFNAGTPVMRTGMTYLDNVELFNCSQRDGSKAALRW